MNKRTSGKTGRLPRYFKALIVPCLLWGCETQVTFPPYSAQAAACTDSTIIGGKIDSACVANAATTKRVAIQSPLAGAILSDSIISVSGTISEGSSVQVTGGTPPYLGSWVTASKVGTGTWTAMVKLYPGKVVLRAVALDSTGAVFDGNLPNGSASFDTVVVTYTPK